MARTKSDIANSAIRIFFQRVGEFYDEKRGFEKLVPTKKQKRQLLNEFDSECCYCGAPIDEKTMSQDHLVPMNKASLGLHAWGNVVPCCQKCNNEKQQRDWAEFLRSKSSDSEHRKRRKKIADFVKRMNYQPNLHLEVHANNLYQDVGEVAMTLIGLRIKQAEEEINTILGE
jgi:hypothetical protein